MKFQFICILTSILLANSVMAQEKSIYDYWYTSLDGEKIKLESYKGKKLLIVNTASECGYTYQYKQLQELFEAHGDKLVIIAFPSNDFGKQEPGTNEEIAAFCEKNYGVTFPVSEKITVRGDEMHPIFKWLTSKELNGVKDVEVKWNFYKFLIDGNGNFIDAFHSKIEPVSEEILEHLMF